MNKFIKITEENYYNSFVGEDYSKWLADNVGINIFGSSCDYQMSLELSVIDCESPIEQLLAVELERLNISNLNFYNPFIDVVAVEKQKEILIDTKKYRVDFLISVIYKNQGEKYFVIECDGYEFHQKTKKQVESDNKRQRVLQKAGYEVIRFSGTEIYHKPAKCACEVKDLILSKCEYKK